MESIKDYTVKNKRYYSRRGFITSCTLCGACFSVSPLSLFGTQKPLPFRKRLNLRVIYSLHALVQAQPDWPNIGYDFRPVIENINTMLIKEFPEFEFISTLATGQEDAEKILNGDKTEKVDGYIVYQMNCWNRVVHSIAKSGKPLLYIDYEYAGSGGFLVYNSDFLRLKQQNVGFISSPRMEDLKAAVSAFNIIARGGNIHDFVSAVTRSRIKSTPLPGDMLCKDDVFTTLPLNEWQWQLKQSKILAVQSQESRIAEPMITIPVEYISFAEVNHAWENADRNKAVSVAESWQEKASEVTGVPFEVLCDSAAMYLGMKSVMQKHRANAITVNCLGGFYNNHIHAYPCLGFHELANEGLIGGCECDVRSAATMVAFTTLTKGRPGFISDPVIDTSKRRIIYAHCVASNKVFGPDGPENPFSISTHSEDRQGAAVRSILPVGYMITTIQIKPELKQILLHQGKAVDNDPDDRACRTKLCAEPAGDLEKLFRYWRDWGWHRVTFYGDLRQQVYGLADALGWKVTEEA